MLGIILTLPLIVLVLAVGVCLPWLGLHLELMHRINQRHAADLAASSKVLHEYEATIEAYRTLVATEVNFSPVPLPAALPENRDRGAHSAPKRMSA